MSGQVIFFSVVLGAGPMCVGGEVTVLSSYLLRFAHDHSYCKRPTVCGSRADNNPMPENP